MQVRIRFSAEEFTIPIATTETLQGLIYKAIKTDPAYSRSLHDRGREFEGKSFKLFTFSELSGKYRTEGKSITYLGEAVLTVSSCEAHFIGLLMQYFLPSKEVRLGNNTVTVASAELLSESISSEAVAIRTTSPITVYVTEEDGRTKYFSPADFEFYEGIVSNARRKWASKHGTDEGFSLTVTPLKGASFKKRATCFKTTYITAWHGSFVLRGAPQILDFLLNTGLGAKNSQGFGAFEVIREEK